MVIVRETRRVEAMRTRLAYRVMRVRNELAEIATEMRASESPDAFERQLHRCELAALEVLAATMEARGLLLERRAKI